MWRRGVRYVIVEKHTTLQAAQLGRLHLAVLDTAHGRAATWPESLLLREQPRRRSRLRLARLRGLQAGSTEASRARRIRHTSDSWAVSATAARSRPVTSDVSGLLIAGVRNPRSYGVARYTARLAEALAEEQIVYRLEERPTRAARTHFHLANSSRALSRRTPGAPVDIRRDGSRRRSADTCARSALPDARVPTSRRSAAVIVHSRFAADMLVREAGKRPARLEVIPHPAQRASND